MPDKTSINDQVTDSVAELQKMLLENKEGNMQAISYQIMAHAAGLAMLNAVYQQQQMYILQNAVTTATAKAVLESKPDEAVKIVKEFMNENDLLKTFSGLKDFMDDLNKTYEDIMKKKPENFGGKKEKARTSGTGNKRRQGNKSGT